MGERGAGGGVLRSLRDHHLPSASKATPCSGRTDRAGAPGGVRAGRRPDRARARSGPADQGGVLHRVRDALHAQRRGGHGSQQRRAGVREEPPTRAGAHRPRPERQAASPFRRAKTTTGSCRGSGCCATSRSSPSCRTCTCAGSRWSSGHLSGRAIRGPALGSRLRLPLADELLPEGRRRRCRRTPSSPASRLGQLGRKSQQPEPGGDRGRRAAERGRDDGRLRGARHRGRPSPTCGTSSSMLRSRRRRGRARSPSSQRRDRDAGREDASLHTHDRRASCWSRVAGGRGVGRSRRRR